MRDVWQLPVSRVSVRAAAVIMAGLLLLSTGAYAGPIRVSVLNRATDRSGVWDATVRHDFDEAMTKTGNLVTGDWRHGRQVLVAENLSHPTMRMIVVDHALFIGPTRVGGYHFYDGSGAYAIFDISIALQDEGAAGPYLFGSHELEEMLTDPWLTGSEIADPVVCCSFDLTLSDGSVVTLSDFVLRNWYKRGSSGPWDFAASPLITGPLQFGPNGY